MPGLLESADFLTPLGRLGRLEVLTTPLPQASWSRRVQTLTPVMNRDGSTKPGVVQHMSLIGQFAFVLPPASHPPWMPAHLAMLPHLTHAGCSQVGDDPSAVTVKVV